VRVKTDGNETSLACAGVFVLIGLTPNTAFLPADLDRDASGAIITGPGGRTSMSGIWAVGAVRAGFGGLLSDAASDAERAIANLG
jgi:thioredoxin reductase (NADPH)